MLLQPKPRRRELCVFPSLISLVGCAPPRLTPAKERRQNYCGHCGHVIAWSEPYLVQQAFKHVPRYILRNAPVPSVRLNCWLHSVPPATPRRRPTAVGLFCKNKSSAKEMWHAELRQHAIKTCREGKRAPPIVGYALRLTRQAHACQHENLMPPMYVRKRAEPVNGESVPKLPAQGNNPTHYNENMFNANAIRPAAI